MKRLMLLPAMILSIACSVRAQENDSINLKADSLHQPVVPGEQSPRLSAEAEFLPHNTERISPDQVPPFLRRTLQDEKYKGWKQGEVYRNISTQQYKVVITTARQKETFFFDQQGNRVRQE